jgi:hypothetical protein
MSEAAPAIAPRAQCTLYGPAELVTRIVGMVAKEM